MKGNLNFGLLLVSSLLLSAVLNKPVAQTGESATVNKTTSIEKGLFDSDEVFTITLKGNIKDLLKDRTSDPKFFPMDLIYTKEDSTQLVMPVQVRTRGYFRRLKENCNYPPLLIDFPKEGPHQSSIFKDQKKTKLVMPCKGEEYVVREWLTYKLYNLVTPKSFKARLVRVVLDDASKGKATDPFYGILLEEEKQMAKRNKMVSIEPKLRPEQTRLEEFLVMAVFQYLIGNTDWSVQYLQNIKLIAADSVSIPMTVPYDFDHAGIVNAPYAHPAEELLMTSVRQRRYRGYCMPDLKAFEPVIARYNSLKDDIYNLYTSCTLIDAKYIKSTTQFLDDFYKIINNPKTWKYDFAYPCDQNGTGNVVIKGFRDERE
jgi:hypothetical protein